MMESNNGATLSGGNECKLPETWRRAAQPHVMCVFQESVHTAVITSYVNDIGLLGAISCLARNFAFAAGYIDEEQWEALGGW